MKSILTPIIWGNLLVLGLSILGCAPVGGSSGAPIVAQEELTEIPFEPSAPRFSLIVDKVELKLHQYYLQDPHQPLMPAEEYLASMLTSCLGRNPHFQLYDKLYSQSSKINPRPLIVKVILTESDPFSTIDESSFNTTRPESALGKFFRPFQDIFLFLIGAYTGLPTGYASAEVKGVVGLDVVVTDAVTGTIVTSFPVHGTHTEKTVQIGSNSSGLTIINSARSTYSGASRAALSEATRILFEKLKDHPELGVRG
jgi:hypothetical protein